MTRSPDHGDHPISPSFMSLVVKRVSDLGDFGDSVRFRRFFWPLAVLRASVVGFAFPITRDVGDHGDSGDRRALRTTALCLRPSATDPTPHRALLKTKAKVQFERPVKRLSTPLFYVFQQSNPAQFQPSFS